MQNDSNCLCYSRILAVAVAAVVVFGVTVPRIAAADSTLTREEAIERAVTYSGMEPLFEGINPDSIIAQRITVEESEIPFLAKLITGRDAWEVVFTNVRLQLPDWMPWSIDNQTIKDFHITIDAGTGQLLRVTAQAVEKTAQYWHDEPTAGSAEEQLRGSGEVFHGLVDSVPEVNLLEALNAAAGTNSPMARALTCVLVMHSKGQAGPRQAWSITGIGLPPQPKSFMEGGLDSTDHTRSVVDASTGKLLMVTNRPHVVPKGEY